MPGPDDTLFFLQRYADTEGYKWPDDVDPAVLADLKTEAELLRAAQRGLDTLLKLHLQPAVNLQAEHW